MKRIVLLTLILCLTASTVSAAVFGVRGGFTLSPDQIHLGGHVDLGPVSSPLRLVPNVEIGFGDSLTTIALNGDVIYDFDETPWSVGGELGLNINNYDSDIPGVDSSSTDFGLSVLGNYRLPLNSSKILLLELKLGLIDSSNAKFTVGWNF